MTSGSTVKTSKVSTPTIELGEIVLDGAAYHVEVLRKRSRPPEAPRLVVVSHVTNPAAEELLKVCLAAVEHFTPEPHELWVVDNNSPRERVAWLCNRPEVNVLLNRTEPLPKEARETGLDGSVSCAQRTWGSYANAVGLELAVRLIDPACHYFMAMHMDVMPCRVGWLSFLVSKLGHTVGAAGVRMDKTRIPEGVLHVLGYVVDFRLFKRLGLDFFPDLPRYDVGDRVTVELRRAGLQVFACPNTIWESNLRERIPLDSPLRDLHVDRAFDDNGNVVFLHLGRGIRKSDGEHSKGTTVEQWAEIAEKLFMPVQSLNRLL